MNPILDQVRQALNEYKKTISIVITEGTIKNPECWAWLSCITEKENWPDSGEFDKARENKAFRNFRAAFKKYHEVMEGFNIDRWGTMPRSSREEYIEICKKMGGVPF